MLELLRPSARRRARPPRISDDTLVRAAATQDDRRAFAELVRRHRHRVRGLLVRLTGNRSTAEDLTQETFMRAYRGLPRFEGRSRFSTWVHRIAYRVYLNHRDRSRTFAPLPAEVEATLAANQGEFSPRQTDLRRDVDRALTALPIRYRRVIELYYLRGVPYTEIAAALEIPLGTVKTNLHRAKKMLGQELTVWAA